MGTKYWFCCTGCRKLMQIDAFQANLEPFSCQPLVMGWDMEGHSLPRSCGTVIKTKVHNPVEAATSGTLRR